MVVGAALGMADDDGGGAGIGQHLGGDVAGVGAGRLGVAILAADGDGRAARGFGKAREQSRRRAHHQVGLAGDGAGAGDNLAKLRG